MISWMTAANDNSLLDEYVSKEKLSNLLSPSESAANSFDTY